MGSYIYYEHLEDYEKQCENAKKYDKLRKNLLNSKLISDEEWREYEKLKRDNNDLRRIYLNTARTLRENGHEELADYFLAQIDAVPTFTVETFDWYKIATEDERVIRECLCEIEKVKSIVRLQHLANTHDEEWVFDELNGLEIILNGRDNRAM